MDYTKGEYYKVPSAHSKISIPDGNTFRECTMIINTNSPHSYLPHGLITQLYLGIDELFTTIEWTEPEFNQKTLKKLYYVDMTLVTSLSNFIIRPANVMTHEGQTGILGRDILSKTICELNGINETCKLW